MHVFFAPRRFPPCPAREVVGVVRKLLSLAVALALARDLEAVVSRYLPDRPVKLLSGTDRRGRRWLRVVVLLGSLGSR